MIDLQELLSRLDGVTHKGGGQYMARCPAHDDKRQSLAVRAGDTGALVINCRAGCAMDAVLAKIGLTVADITPDNRKKPSTTDRVRTASPAKPVKAPEEPPAPKEPKPATYTKVGDVFHCCVTEEVEGKKREVWVDERITHAYEYTDAQGAPLLRVFRTENKQFPVIHYADGQWWKGDGGVKEAFYRLPELLKAIKAGEPVYVAEGEKDVDNLRKIGLPATTNKGGASVWPEAFAQKTFADAIVYILPDNDEPGRKHAQAVSRSLDGYAKEVRVLSLTKLCPQLPSHGDVSDVIEALGIATARAELPKLASKSRVLSRKIDDREYAEYYDGVQGVQVKGGGISVFDSRSESYKPICNFVAMPIEEIDKDNGLEAPEKFLKIAGWDVYGTRLRTLTVPMAKFSGMGWVLEGWGLAANIYARNNAEKTLRSAIQEAGRRASVQRTIYTHTGWRMIGGQPVYLHGGGAIGADDVGVELEYGFDRYDLRGIDPEDFPEMAPGKPDQKEAYLRAYAIIATQECFNLAPMRITTPLIGFMFLCPLRHFFEQLGMRPSFIPYVRGRSGTGKSSLVALLLGHYGRRFSYEGRQPANFGDSANAISRKLFVLKDMPLLVDDYHPEEDIRRKREMDGVAQAISRMIGDGATRSRMRQDTTAQTDIPSRGLCIETGEDLPNIKESGVGRLYVIDVKNGDIDVYGEGMRNMWQDVWRGVLSETMRGYIDWLRGQYTALPKKLSGRYNELQRYAAEHLPKGVHKRMPTAIAYIMLGLDQMVDYFIAAGSVFPGEKQAMMDAWWAAVLENSQEQQVEMGDEKPTEIYLTTIRELLVSGKAIILPLTGTPGDVINKPIGLIGYRDKDYYYLIPGMAYSAVQRSCQEQGSAYPVGKTMLHKMLREDGKILPDPSTGRNVRQLARGAVRGWMLWIPCHVLDGTEPPKPKPEQQRIDLSGGDERDA